MYLRKRWMYILLQKSNLNPVILDNHYLVLISPVQAKHSKAANIDTVGLNEVDYLGSF